MKLHESLTSINVKLQILCMISRKIIISEVTRLKKILCKLGKYSKLHAAFSTNLNIWSYTITWWTMDHPNFTLYSLILQYVVLTDCDDEKQHCTECRCIQVVYVSADGPLNSIWFWMPYHMLCIWTLHLRAIGLCDELNPLSVYISFGSLAHHT